MYAATACEYQYRLRPCAPPMHGFAAAAQAHEQDPYQSIQQTAETLTNHLCAFAHARKMEVNPGHSLSWEKITACVQHAVQVMNATAGANWGRLFQLNARGSEGVFLLEFSCNMAMQGDFVPASDNVQQHESVVARLKLTLRTPRKSTQEKLIVCMAAGATAVCVRHMHMATILRACALLVAQQIAYLGSGSESVRFMRDPVSEATQRIYQKLFSGLGDAHRRDCTTMTHGDDSCHEMSVQLFNPGPGTIAKSTWNVSEFLWYWYRQSEYMYHQPLPLQIRRPPHAHFKCPPHAPTACSVCENARLAPAHASEPARAWLPQTCHRAPAQMLVHAQPLFEYRDASLSPWDPATCHRAPAQMLVHAHPLFKYGTDRLVWNPSPGPECEDWEHVLAHFPDASLQFQTIKEWTYGRCLCFWIWWQYTWDVVRASASELDNDMVDEKLKRAFLLDSIPGAGVADFFAITPEQIAQSTLVTIKCTKDVDHWNWIRYGVECCKNADYAEGQNANAQYINVFDTLMLFFVLKARNKRAEDRYSIYAVRSAFCNFLDTWDESRVTFAEAFAILQTEYNKGQRISDATLWDLISHRAPAISNTGHNTRAASP